jgi:DNA repair exonuclease SbcCD nuclease subunit
MKPSYLLLTDTHIHDGNIDLVTDIFNQAIKYCLENNIKTIFHLGDWFTSRKAQSLAILKATEYIINSFKENGVICYAIKGNHDSVQADSTDSFIDIFASDNFIVVKEERTMQFGDLDISFIPYFKEDGSYRDRLDKLLPLNKKRFNVLLTHISIDSVKNNDGSQQENDLKVGLFKPFDFVAVGHFHNRSQLSKNIHYIGSSHTSNYGEDNDKGFVHLYGDGSFDFIQSKFKQYIKLKLDITDEKAIKAAEKQYKNSDDNIRFIFEGEEAELKNVNKEKFASLGIDVTFNKDSAVPIDNNGLIEKATSVSFNRQGIDSAFETFCEMKHIEDNSVGVKYLKQI